MNMPRHLRAGLLAGALGLGVMAGMLRADGPPPVPGPASSGPIVTYAGPSVEYPSTTSGPDDATGGRRRPIKDWVSSWGCWSHHNSLRCGSLRADWNFVFGSCRTFFGERCLKGPPTVAMPPGYGQPSDGCNCR